MPSPAYGPERRRASWTELCKAACREAHQYPQQGGAGSAGTHQGRARRARTDVGGEPWGLWSGHKGCVAESDRKMSDIKATRHRE
jgi:CelD/BcsL family acetyltransferase involved in cellulose biosynthesis